MVEDKNNLVEKMRELPRVIDSKVEFVSLIKHNRAPNGLINYGPDEISLLKNYLNNLGEKGYLSQKDSAESIFITNKLKNSNNHSKQHT